MTKIVDTEKKRTIWGKAGAQLESECSKKFTNDLETKIKLLENPKENVYKWIEQIEL